MLSENRHFSKFPSSHSKSSRFYLFLTRVGANQFPAFFDQAKLDYYDKVFPAKTVLRALRREEQSWQERPSHTTITITLERPPPTPLSLQVPPSIRPTVSRTRLSNLLGPPLAHPGYDYLFFLLELFLKENSSSVITSAAM